MSSFAFAKYTTIKAKVTHPDSEVKNYSHFPQKIDDVFIVPTTSKMNCIITPSYFDKTKIDDGMDGVSLICMNSKNSKSTDFQTYAQCNSKGTVVNLYDETPKSKKRSKTEIYFTCE